MPTDMTNRTQEVLDNPPGETSEVDPLAKKKKKRNDQIRSIVETCKTYRRKLVENWSISIDYRRGKGFSSESDTEKVTVPLDWSFTKTKQASLFSQVPQIRVNHHPETMMAGPGLHKFESRVNDTLKAAGIEAAMDEVLPDCINASGIGVALVSFESITEDKEVPKMDLSMLPPEIAAQALQTGMLDGQPIEMEVVPQVVDKRYVIQRISPSDFIWPLNFVGSDFNQASLIGRSGRIPWAEAAKKYKLTDADKESVLGEDRSVIDRLTHDIDKDQTQPDQMVGFDEIWYKEFQYNEDASSYHTLHHLVYLHGKHEPVVDEPWKGQKIDESGKVLGARKFPLQVISLAYISDECIPPSDSAIGRGQVDELNQSRTDRLKQRRRNVPVRWFDVNRVDPTIQQSLMRGTWQAMIPVQGDGSRIIGEVAKVGHPQEDPSFDQVAKNDLSEAWTIGNNQLGSGVDVETKGEANEIASNFQTRVGRERAKVASFFVNIGEILGSLMCLYEDPAEFGEGFDPGLSALLEFSILADSTVLVDSNLRLKRLNDFVNTYAKSGWVALEPVLKEIASLTGLDPNVVIKAPEPAPPAEPNISLRLTGGEDMMNPLLLAFMMKSGQAPEPDLIMKAKELIQSAVVVPSPPPNPADGQIPPPGGPAGGVPPPPPPAVGEANPDATILPTIKKRSDDPSGGQI